MTEKPREFHPLADLFPLLEGEEYQAFIADVAANGLRDAIWLHPDGRIIDGRNRYRACLDAGIEPIYRTWNEQGSLLMFVVSMNIHRRHLNESQRAMVAMKVENLKHGGDRKNDQDANLHLENVSRAEAAKLLNVSPRSVATAAQVRREATPEVIRAIEKGEKTITQVKRELGEEKREQRRQENAQKAAATTDLRQAGAKFATIVIDPPWSLEDEGDVNQLGRAKQDYASMPIDEILKLPIAELADEDCHLYLWITNRSLPKGFSLLDAWGFRYVTLLTWPKSSFGMGNYFRGQTEHVLFGVRGSQALKRKDASTLLPTWKRGPGGHSSKPVEFYNFVESCSPAPLVEIFSRQQHDGWSSWGADA